MSHWLALFLGIVQGLTEFLPISSSGHMTLIRHLFHIEGSFVFFDLIVHIATLSAVVICLWREIITYWKWIVVGTLPLLPLVFLVKRFETLPIIGICFLITATLLFASERLARSAQQKGWHAFGIGALQALAVLPGLSRSGATIAGARFLGWERADAVRFSFILSLPAILGGTALQFWKGTSLEGVSWGACGVGFAAAFGVGLFTLRWFLRKVEKGRLTPFAWYCLALGIVTLVVL